MSSNLRLLFEEVRESNEEVDGDVLPEYFSGTMSPWSGRTVWRSLRQVRPGNVLMGQGSSFEELPVWRPRCERPRRFKGNNELDETFRTLLFDGVQRALRSPSPVLCDLSGGFDSSTTTAVAASLSGDNGQLPPVVAWSTRSSRSTNEGQLQEAVQAQYGFESHTLAIEDHLPFTHLEIPPIPIGDFVQTGALYRAMRGFAERRGIGTRITGFAGDAIFQKGLQAPIYFAEWLRQGRVTDVRRHFAAYLKGGTFSPWHLLKDCCVGTLDLRAGHSQTAPPSWFTRKFRLAVGTAEQEFRAAAPRAFRSEARERMHRFTLCFIPLPGQMLPDERLPLIYRPLFEFMVGLDWEHLVTPGETRPLMRRALDGLLPKPVTTGKADARHGAAFIEGLQQAWPALRKYATGEHLAQLGVLEPKMFRSALETFRAGYDKRLHQYLATAIYLELWLGLRAEVPSRNPWPHAA